MRYHSISLITVPRLFGLFTGLIGSAWLDLTFWQLKSVAHVVYRTGRVWFELGALFRDP